MDQYSKERLEEWVEHTKIILNELNIPLYDKNDKIRPLFDIFKDLNVIMRKEGFI